MEHAQMEEHLLHGQASRATKTPLFVHAPCSVHTSIFRMLCMKCTGSYICRDPSIHCVRPSQHTQSDMLHRVALLAITCICIAHQR